MIHIVGRRVKMMEQDNTTGLRHQIDAIHREVEDFRNWSDVPLDDILRTFHNICYALYRVNKRLNKLEGIEEK